MSERQEPVDLEALGLGEYAKKARTATFAPNWKTVLWADASLGFILMVIGVILSRWIAWLGWALVALGVIYVMLVGRRFLQWRWLREQADLPT